jgi:hypothetical protein
MRLAALIALTLCACAHGLPPDSVDAQAVSAVECAWRVSGLPGPGSCLDLVDVRRHDSRDGYVDQCEGLSPGAGSRDAAQHSAGCLTSELRGLIGKRVWVVHVAPGYHADAALVEHELRHALTYCHLDRPRSDPFDAQHSDLRVWR